MNEENLQVDPLLLEFLDLDSYREREEFISRHSGELSERTLDAMAVSLDIVLDDTNQLFDKAEQLLRCIRTNAKYETDRFR
ncbi:MAG: hypothetical protein K6B39_07770 [Lachnospiraceae bacterium]|nr:hypothetical protein [Lachnospiraceae bacterium]